MFQTAEPIDRIGEVQLHIQRPFSGGHQSQLSRSTDQSIALNQRESGCIIIAGSGMCTGGRILHHLRRHLPEPQNVVVLAGYHLSILAAKRPDLFMAELAEVQELIAQGVIAPEEPTARPLDELAQAMIDLQGRKTTGKIVITP